MILYWSLILAFSILLYVLLDGFDLGVGMLFGLTRDETRRRHMLAAVSPLWDGNETWLIVAGVVLWGAFSVAYSLLVSAFYVPVMLMLAGLIFRGVAFEFRGRARRTRAIWDVGFVLGSLVAAFMQGAMVGALVKGLPVVNGRFTGDVMTWCSSFSALCGVALCAGYALLGASWVVRKCEADARDAAYRAIAPLLLVVLVLLIVLFFHALHENLAIMHRWLDRPYLFLVPLIALCAIVGTLTGVRRRRDDQPFLMIVLLFICAYAMLAISFWPYMVPFSLTVAAAASPHASLAFMFWGEGLFIYPLMLGYTAYSYHVFKGKVDLTSGHY
ncbi:cytochrome d ubiquinol oxidase subunit II [Paraburkholderia sp. GAS32]|uniref:cytochrome d ubiquinol oxidase subunit II n=1 Tax=Paraburkholderia sp. GAS32 TaxID=3035129 RepID=UPI003D2511D9